LKGEKGQGLAEYGLIIVLVALAAAVAIGLFGGQIARLFGRITDQLSSP
jgi:Flp pilus assembly pilin Flp